MTGKYVKGQRCSCYMFVEQICIIDTIVLHPGLDCLGKGDRIGMESTMQVEC